MAKRPSFQFYPGDWLRDTALRSCSMQARALWIDMLCYMTDTEPYGYLKVGNKVILPTNLAPMVGLTILECETLLQELREAGIFSEDEQKCIFSRRMVNDEETRKKRAQGGILGGNPALKGNKNISTKVNLKDNHIDNLSLEDEDEIKDEEENKDLKGGVGENFENESQKKELVYALMIEFNFSEIRSPDKLRLLWQFANHLESGKGIDYFIQTFQSYKKWKEISGEKSHNFMGLIGTPAMNFENGGWDADNWQHKIDNYKPQGKTNPVSRLEQAQRLYESTRKG